MKKFELTGQQESIFSIEQFYKNTPINNLAGVFIIKEQINKEILFNSINLFIKNADSFRIKIGISNSNIPYQYISDYSKIDFSLLNFNNITDVNAYAKEIANQPIFAYDSLLFRFIPFVLSDKTGGFIFVAHHLISDAWSIQLIIDRILNYYAFLSNKTDSIPEYNNYSYIDFINSSIASILPHLLHISVLLYFLESAGTPIILFLHIGHFLFLLIFLFLLLKLFVHTFSSCFVIK